MQYLKKEVRNGVNFYMQINIKVPKSWHYLFWLKLPDMSKLSKIGSLIFSQYVKKKGLQLLFCSIAIFRCFMGVQSCLLLLVFVCLYIYIHIFVLVKNDVLLLVPTGNVLELGFPNAFNKRLTNCGKIVSCLRKYSNKLCQMTRNLQSFS